jgi:hypothetical protein
VYTVIYFTPLCFIHCYVSLLFLIDVDDIVFYGAVYVLWSFFKLILVVCSCSLCVVDFLSVCSVRGTGYIVVVVLDRDIRVTAAISSLA